MQDGAGAVHVRGGGRLAETPQGGADPVHQMGWEPRVSPRARLMLAAHLNHLATVFRQGGQRGQEQCAQLPLLRQLCGGGGPGSTSWSHWASGAWQPSLRRFRQESRAAFTTMALTQAQAAPVGAEPPQDLDPALLQDVVGEVAVVRDVSGQREELLGAARHSAIPGSPASSGQAVALAPLPALSLRLGCQVEILGNALPEPKPGIDSMIAAPWPIRCFTTEPRAALKNATHQAGERLGKGLRESR